jgi:hypothetical protein
MEEKEFYFILVRAFFMKRTTICLDYVFVGVMMMKEKFVEENVLEKLKVMLGCKV